MAHTTTAPKQFFERDDYLHIVARLALADPQVIAQALLYEAKHGERYVFDALAQLLDANANEAGQNIAAIVATANLEVNKVENYLFEEREFAKEICKFLSPAQIDELLRYNKANLQNFEPNKEVTLIREVFGHPIRVKPGEGNSHIKCFLEQGKEAASQRSSLVVPQSKPAIRATKPATMPLCMLSMCLAKGYLPLRKHDPSHVHSGFDTTIKGEIYNQTHDLGQNSLAQYGVVPNFREQLLNRKIIYSFAGLPQKIKSIKREWRGYVADALETWRLFLVEHPEYVQKWGLGGLVDKDMRMIKPDGTPIISAQTKEQQIPVIDYTDVAILRHLRKSLDRLLTDEEVYGYLPYDHLYIDALRSLDLMAYEYVLRDGKPPVMLNGILDSSATYKHNREDVHGADLKQLSDQSHYTNLQLEKVKTMTKRARLQQEGKWCGYLVDFGQDRDKKMWVTDAPPAISILHPKSITVYRVTLPLSAIKAVENKPRFEVKSDGDRPVEERAILSGAEGYLVDASQLQIESTLSQRDDSQILNLSKQASRKI